MFKLFLLLLIIPFLSFELFTYLQLLGVKSKHSNFPDEKYWVVKPQKAKLLWNTMFDWFNENKMPDS